MPIHVCLRCCKSALKENHLPSTARLGRHPKPFLPELCFQRLEGLWMQITCASISHGLYLLSQLCTPNPAMVPAPFWLPCSTIARHPLSPQGTKCTCNILGSSLEVGVWRTPTGVLPSAVSVASLHAPVPVHPAVSYPVRLWHHRRDYICLVSTAPTERGSQLSLELQGVKLTQ